jgi:hypothetical protein
VLISSQRGNNDSKLSDPFYESLENLLHDLRSTNVSGGSMARGGMHTRARSHPSRVIQLIHILQSGKSRRDTVFEARHQDRCSGLSSQYVLVGFLCPKDAGADR